MVCTTDPVGFFNDCCDRPPPNPIFCRYSYSANGVSDQRAMKATGGPCPNPLHGLILQGADFNPIRDAWLQAIQRHDADRTARDCTDEAEWTSEEGGLSCGLVQVGAPFDRDCNGLNRGISLFGHAGAAGYVRAGYAGNSISESFGFANAAAHSNACIFAQAIPISTGPDIATEHGIATIRVKHASVREGSGLFFDPYPPSGWGGEYTTEVSSSCTGFMFERHCNLGTASVAGTLDFEYGSTVNDCPDFIAELFAGTSIKEVSITPTQDPATVTTTNLTAVTGHLAGGSDNWVYWMLTPPPVRCFSDSLTAYPGNPSGNLSGDMLRISNYTSTFIKQIQWLDSASSVIRQWDFIA